MNADASLPSCAVPTPPGLTAPAPERPLSADQQVALDGVLDAHDSGEPVITVAGWPGTGKTYLLNAVVQRLRERGRTVILGGPTWKACARLREVLDEAVVAPAPPVSLHSLTYAGPDETPEPSEEEVLRHAQDFATSDGSSWEQLSEAQHVRLLADARTLLLAQGSGALTFSRLRDWTEDDVPISMVLVLDEASMPDERIVSDFRAAASGAQIVAAGDPEQLPPIDGRPGFDLARPTTRLTQIHRQREGSAILDLLALVRETRPIHRNLSRLASRVGIETCPGSIERVATTLAKAARATLDEGGARALRTCGHLSIGIVTKNRTRVEINERVRKLLGFPPLDGVTGPTSGERVIAMSTNRTLAVGSGESGVVLASEPGPLVQGGYDTTRMAIDFGVGPVEVYCLNRWWGNNALETADAMQARAKARGEGAPSLRRLMVPPRYVVEAITGAGLQGHYASAKVSPRLLALAPGWACTTHLAQGSQWPAGVVYAEWAGWMKDDEYRLWNTAISRFARRVVIMDEPSRWQR